MPNYSVTAEALAYTNRVFSLTWLASIYNLYIISMRDSFLNWSGWWLCFNCRFCMSLIVYFWNWWSLANVSLLGYFISLEDTFFHHITLTVSSCESIYVKWFLHITFTIFVVLLLLICIFLLWHCIRVSLIRCRNCISLTSHLAIDDVMTDIG